MKILKGKPASGGIAIGKATGLVSENAGFKVHFNIEESKRLYFRLKEKVDAELKDLGGENSGEAADSLLDSYLMLINDPVFEETVLKKISQGIGLFDAIKQSGEEIAESLRMSDDEYLKERSADVLGVSDELLRQLSAFARQLRKDEAGKEDVSGNNDEAGNENVSGNEDAPGNEGRAYQNENAPTDGDESEELILVAEALLPTQLLRLNKKSLRGIVLSQGSLTDHTSILAGNMGIPCIIGLGDELLHCEPQKIVIDGDSGTVYLDPDKTLLDSFGKKLRSLRKKREDTLNKLRSGALSDRKCKISVMANISSIEDAKDADRNHADGIGLFRTEFLYLRGDDYPTEMEQFEAYRAVLGTMGERRVIIRTCDIGYDKAADYMQLPYEENPGMGIRGIRVSLENPEMFITQLRALYRASIYGNLQIMFPMISSLREIILAKKYCEEAQRLLRKENIPFKQVPLGIMIETPAAALLSDEFAKEVDFFSIGSNDLTQYTTGADRINSDMEKYYDSAHPAVLKLIEMTVENAHKNGIPAGICGELAADFAMSDFFIKIGIDELSVSAPKVIPLKLELENTLKSNI